MAANTSPIFVRQANLGEVTFVNADGTTPKDLVVAGADGTKVIRINAVSDDTATVNMQVFIHDGSAAYLLGTAAVATLAGTNGTTASKNLLDPALVWGVDRDGELLIPAGYKVQVAPKAAVTAGKTVTVIGLAGDY
jgi:hypothetical protein